MISWIHASLLSYFQKFHRSREDFQCDILNSCLPFKLFSKVSQIQGRLFSMISCIHAYLLSNFQMFHRSREDFSVHDILNSCLPSKLFSKVSQIQDDILYSCFPLKLFSKVSQIQVKFFSIFFSFFQALLCSSFIPFYSGMIPPAYKGVVSGIVSIVYTCPQGLSQDLETGCLK